MFQELLDLSCTEWRPFGLEALEGSVGLAKTVELGTPEGARRHDIYLTFAPGADGAYSPALLLELDYDLLGEVQGGWLALEFSADGEVMTAIPVQLQQLETGAVLCTLSATDVNEAFQCFLSERELRLTLHAPCGLLADFFVPSDPSLLAGRAKVAAVLDRADNLASAQCY